MAPPAPMPDELLTAAQRAQYLEQLRQGIPAGLAARALGVEGVTGTRLRACRKRDPLFGAECEEAMREGREHYVERLSAAARVRALDGSDRILEVELATHVPGYSHLRRDRLQVDARIEHAIILTPAQIESLDDEKLAALDEILAAADGALVVDGEFTEIHDELPPASGNGNTG